MKLVLVEWIDSYGCSPNWVPLEASNPQPMRCKSVGWLLYDGPDCKVIVPHVSDDSTGSIPAQGCGDMTIPVKAILKIRKLR